MAGQSTLSLDQLKRGETPADIEQRCLDLCQIHIGGSWNQAKSPTDITVTRITGGITNQLYRVKLNPNVPRVVNPLFPEAEPTDVAVKIYLKKHMTCGNDEEGSERLGDNIVLTLMSQTGFGPQVYGIFNDGNIQAFLEHELFGPKYHQNQEMIAKLCRQLARVNHLKVPIRKTNFLVKQTGEFLETGYSNPKVPQLIEQLNLTSLKAKDLRQELIDLTRYIKEVAAPIVFCHNDLLGSNILIVGEEKRILLIDLEYCAYGQRGFDLAMFLCQYGREPFDYDNLELPTDSVLEQYLKCYIEACDEIIPGYSAKPENSLATHVREVKIASLWYMMILMSFFIQTQQSQLDEPLDLEKNLKYIEELYKRYNETKQRLIQDGTIVN